MPDAAVCRCRGAATRVYAIDAAAADYAFSPADASATGHTLRLPYAAEEESCHADFLRRDAARVMAAVAYAA